VHVLVIIVNVEFCSKNKCEKLVHLVGFVSGTKMIANPDIVFTAVTTRAVINNVNSHSNTYLFQRVIIFNT